jgi:hypothetical protein
MIFITGDTHGSFDRLLSLDLTSNDTLIILGDFGGIYDNFTQDVPYDPSVKQLLEKPWTTLFIDGNHENFVRLNALPSAEKYGDEVGVVSDNLFHLKRGRLYTIEGKTFFTFGGAYSIDKNYRVPYVSWWPEELPSEADYHAALNKLIETNYKMDYVLTHTAPYTVIKQLFGTDDIYGTDERPLNRFLDLIYNSGRYIKWYCGHLHIDREITPKFQALYNDVVPLTLEEPLASTN